MSLDTPHDAIAFRAEILYVAREGFAEESLPVVVGLAGSPSSPSQTRTIVQAVIERVGANAGVETRLVDLAALVPDLGIASRAEASPRVEGALKLIERADLLIVGTPVYKGSYAGLLKHLIDLMSYPALLGIPVGLLATGGSDRHAHVIDYQLRPLFSFFGAKTLATGVFVAERMIVNGWVDDPQCRARLDQIVEEAVFELTAARPTESSARLSK